MTVLTSLLKSSLDVPQETTDELKVGDAAKTATRVQAKTSGRNARKLCSTTYTSP